MTYSTPYRFGPGQTPYVIKMLIIITCCVSIFAALTDGMFSQFFSMSGPQDWLSLSWYGMNHYYFWQPLTYMFVQYSGFQGITFFYLFALALNMYILWILGSIVIERVGNAPFLRLYFLSGIVAGLAALLVMPMAGYTILAGITPPMLALLVVWTMLHPEAEILLFFLIPAKVKWLTTGILGAIGLMTLSQLDFVHFVFYLTGAFFGYLYSLLAWNLQGPFPFTHPFDHQIAKVGIFVRQRFNKWKKKKSKGDEKIVKFPESELNDDQFVDAMLAKISRQGENSLSWSEKRRMDEISRKHSENNH